MERNDVIRELSQFFSVKELVCDHTYARWKDASWQFLDTNYLHALLVIRRDILKTPMTCNAGLAHQRGLRCNMCELVSSKKNVYISAHILGKAGDFTCKGMTAEQARRVILAHKEWLPCNIRMEDGVSWLHFDVLPQWGVEDKVHLFRA